VDAQGYAKLCDYGLSKFMAVGETTKTFLGTAAYLSPEQVREDPYDHQIDIWGLGVSTYEMAYGFTPFEPKGMLSDDEWRAGTKKNISSASFTLTAEVLSKSVLYLLIFLSHLI